MTLLITLVLLGAILLLGSAAAKLLLQDMQAARQYQAQTMARTAAQAALDDALADLAGGTRAAMLTSPDAFPAHNGCAAQHGLCRGSPRQPGWTRELLDSSAASTYGSFTGARMASAAAPPPRYLIELIADASTDASRPVQWYRLAAIGYGPGNAAAMLQATVRRSPEQSRLRVLSWRTIPF